MKEFFFYFLSRITVEGVLTGFIIGSLLSWFGAREWFGAQLDEFREDAYDSHWMDDDGR